MEVGLSPALYIGGRGIREEGDIGRERERKGRKEGRVRGGEDGI